MDTNSLSKPIFIIAGVRSGTTMMGDILSQHKDLAYWIEPKYIWKYRKPNTTNDNRSASEATSTVKRYIRKKFTGFTSKKGKLRFLEKTPSNVFRVPFINEIFPDALYIQLLRSGIDTALSAEKKWTSPPDGSAIVRRLTSNEIPLIDLPFYLSVFTRNLLGKALAAKRGFLWGQLFEGISEYRKQHSVIETCAKQWVEGLTASQKALDKIDKSQIYTLKYEDFLTDPETALKKIFTFCELTHSNAVIDYAKSTIRANTKSYSDADKKKIALIQPIIEEQMKRYNYV